MHEIVSLQNPTVQRGEVATGDKVPPGLGLPLLQASSILQKFSFAQAQRKIIPTPPGLRFPLLQTQ